MGKVFCSWLLGAAVFMGPALAQAESAESQLFRLPRTPHFEIDPVAVWESVPVIRGQVESEQANCERPTCSGPENGGDADGRGTCGSCDRCSDGVNCNGCCDCTGGWRDNTEYWFGGDAYKSIGDRGAPGFFPLPFGLQNSFGLVSGFNTGLGLGDSRVRAQVGASYGAYDLKGRTTLPPRKDDSLEQQTYMTAGFYKRSDVHDDDRLSWGLVYDYFYARNWGWAANPVSLGQIRGIAGYAVNECNELGGWGTFHAQNETAIFDGLLATPVAIRGMNQANTYWRHHWDFGGTTTAYAGAVDRADVASWQFGLLGQAPLSQNVALYGNYTYVAPGSATGLVGSAEEQWNVSVGLTVYLGGKASSSTVSGHSGLPLLPVANNGSFLVTD